MVCNVSKVHLKTEKIILRIIGHYHLSTLPIFDYQKFIDNFIGKYPITTVRTIHSILCSAVNKAVEEENWLLININNISIKKENDISESKKDYLTKEEIQSFMVAANSCTFNYYIIVSILLRRGII